VQELRSLRSWAAITDLNLRFLALVLRMTLERTPSGKVAKEKRRFLKARRAGACCHPGVAASLSSTDRQVASSVALTGRSELPESASCRCGCGDDNGGSMVWTWFVEVNEVDFWI